MSGRPTARRTTRPGTPSVAARRTAGALLRELVARIAPAQERLVVAVRRWLRRRLPAAHELVYEYRDCVVISCSPNEHGYEGVFALRAAADGVKLYFQRGKGLPDPDGLLQGASTQVRWLLLDRTSTLARPEVVRLVDAAIARHPVPFARHGRGSVSVRPTAATKRRLRRPVERGASRARAHRAAEDR